MNRFAHGVLCLAALAAMAAASDASLLPRHPGPVDGAPPTDFYVILPSSGNGSAASAELTYDLFARYGTTGRLATIRNPKNHFAVHCAGCTTRGSCTGATETVELQALFHGCRYATNGGPFGGKTCITPVITNGTIMSDLPLPAGYQCVAMLKNGSWALGNISTGLYSAIADMHCGFQWLVVNGQALTSSGLEIAPRTVFGIDPTGAMLSLVAEGSEAAYTGLTLNQTAQWALALGALWAINMDGGGSSTSFLRDNNGVQGCPTCIDQPYCCSRSVTTISCIY